MRIQTEYMSFKNHWTISSSNDIQVHQQRSRRRCCFSQTAIQRFPVLPGSMRALPGAPSVVTCARRLVTGAHRFSQVYPKFSPALRGVLEHITMAPMILLFQSSEIPVTPNASLNALLGSHTLLKLTHLSLHSTFSQTLLEASSD